MVIYSQAIKINILVGLLIVLAVCSCKQLPSLDIAQNHHKPSLSHVTNSGLLFERGLNRGSAYTDSLGTEYSFRYAPITITNDTTVTIGLELAFLNEYNYPAVYGDKKFKIIPLPKEWAQNQTTDSMYDIMFDNLHRYVYNPALNKTINPGQTIKIGIGTLVPKPRDISINLDVPFAHTNKGVFETCHWQMSKKPLPNREIALGLKLDINQICIIVASGKIWYPKT